MVNSFVAFQKYINAVLYKYLVLYCILYLDNILTYLEDIKSYIYNVKKVLDYLSKNGLFMKLKKYIFKISKIYFLSFILIMESVTIDLLQISTIKNWLLSKSF